MYIYTCKDGFFDLNLTTTIQINTKGGMRFNPVDFKVMISTEVAAMFTLYSTSTVNCIVA